ncbi:universal stress protein [Segetibacter koreensis]|uniref:universal stress protein n=1 Tax=Segetibacter koreensis TaxID=398037 RepID=UPI00035E2DE7|nr:universal stress protein [Segetibacter koreensis]
MKTTVAPTDFSTTSLNAVNYAADMASVIGTSLSLIHICRFPVAISEVPVSEYSMTELITDAEKQMFLLKDKIAFRTGERIKIMTEIREGEIISELDAYCPSVSTYAVVMGSERTGAIERTLFGGITIAAMRKLKWSLIVVPPEAKFAGIKRIGLACDFKNVVDTIPIKEIRSLVKELHPAFHVLHVSAEKEELFTAESIEQAGWLQEILDGLNPKYHFIKDNEPEKGIADFAEKTMIS